MEVVGISGGEPFVERRGLERATSRFAEAGLRQVVFTSGVWAARRVAPWIDAVLATCYTVYLSADAFHARAVDEESVVRAMRAIAASGAWLVVQALDHDDTVARISKLVDEALGEH